MGAGGLTFVADPPPGIAALMQDTDDQDALGFTAKPDDVGAGYLPPQVELNVMGNLARMKAIHKGASIQGLLWY